MSDILLGLSNLERTKAEEEAMEEIRKLLNKTLKDKVKISEWLAKPNNEVLGGYTPKFFIKGRNATKILELMREGML